MGCNRNEQNIKYGKRSAKLTYYYSVYLIALVKIMTFSGFHVCIHKRSRLITKVRSSFLNKAKKFALERFFFVIF